MAGGPATLPPMVQLLTVVALGVATALATGLGAIPVFFLGRRAELGACALGAGRGRDDRRIDRGPVAAGYG